MFIRTTIAALTLAAVPVAVAAAPASAREHWVYQGTSNFAQTSWVEVGELPGVAGNIHVGNLYVDGYGGALTAWGDVVDWTCPPGVTPPSGEGHGEEPPVTDCTLESERLVYNTEPLTLTLDRRLSKAHLTGRLTVENHGTGATGTPMADITWTGVGGTSTYSSVSRGQNADGSFFLDRFTTTERVGVLSGSIGAMIFDDEPGESSTGSFGSTKMFSQGRTP